MPLSTTENGNDSSREKSMWEQELAEHREVWDQKRALRKIYQRWYSILKSNCVEGGPVLEVGGGGGHFKNYWPDLISSDIVFAPWLDMRLDCMKMPFIDASLKNIVGVDVLHHLSDLDIGMKEISRVIEPGGRMAFFEPFISPFSHLIRSIFHEEDVDMSQEKLFDAEKKPEDANDAVPTLAFWKNKGNLKERFPYFKFLKIEPMDCLAYPLTGGFGHKSILPQPVLVSLHNMEQLLMPLRKLMAFKMLIVAEKIK